eukprot:1035838-Lingulodinium_polyedra.AAC.1
MTITRAVPSGADPRTAEALAAGAALGTLFHPVCPVSNTRCAGDDLGIVRVCAGSGRLSEPRLHGILDG